jgi:hypothetical protein
MQFVLAVLFIIVAVLASRSVGRSYASQPESGRGVMQLMAALLGFLVAIPLSLGVGLEILWHRADHSRTLVLALFFGSWALCYAGLVTLMRHSCARGRRQLT